ncbi:hypothetical protein BXZ70DRAFT_903580 [Cristinia sonorae]|uniref:Uncharacterized protein n=1 Tax=Cristinia sonorae TaxID=1940300 RepID=A0A8K0XU75_9AGAR|nr:hypothetical protein BXZ70DRAFT_903580 [Cristinia sonorae]
MAPTTTATSTGLSRPTGSHDLSLWLPYHTSSPPLNPQSSPADQSQPGGVSGSSPQCCHCGWRGDHAPNCPFNSSTAGRNCGFELPQTSLYPDPSAVFGIPSANMRTAWLDKQERRLNPGEVDDVTRPVPFLLPPPSSYFSFMIHSIALPYKPPRTFLRGQDCNPANDLD